MRKLLVIFLLPTCLIGCASIVSLQPRLQADSTSRYPLYPATVMDVGFAVASARGNTKLFPKPNYLVTAAACIDLPFSLVFDTLWLPYDVIQHQRHDTLAPVPEQVTPEYERN